MPVVPSLDIVLEPDGAPETISEIPSQAIHRVLSDAFSFIRGVEANQALAAVTLEELMEDQIQRNGQTTKANASQYNPYSYNPDKVQPASQTSAEIANFSGGSDTGGPTKLERILVLKNTLSDVVNTVKNSSQPIASDEEYRDEELDQLSTEA